MSSKSEEEYEYQLVEFLRRGPKNGTKQVDFVPCSWISYNMKNGRLEAKFMPPPYTAENCKLLHDLVRNKDLPPESWPVYSVVIRGGARNYEDAVNRLRLLNIQDYAFSQDNEEPNEKVDKIIKRHKQIKLKISSEAKDALRVSGLPDSEEETDKRSDVKQNKVSLKTFRNKKSDKNSKNSDSEIESLQDEPFSAPVSIASNEDSWSESEELEISTRKKQTKNKKSSKKSQEKRPTVIQPIKCRNFASLTSCSQSNPDSSSLLCNSPQFFSYLNTIDGQDIFQKKQDKTTFLVPHSQPKSHNDSTSHVAGQQMINANEIPRKENKIKEGKHKKEKHGQSTSDRKLLLEIYHEVQSLKMDVKEILANQNRAQQVIQGDQILQGIREDFVMKYNLLLPISNEQEFTDFNLKLLQDEEFAKDFMTSLTKYFDRSYVTTKSVGNILKKYLTKDMAMKCTALKKMPNKLLLKGTAFYDHMLGALSQTHREAISGKFITDATFGNALGNVLSNAKDWGGQRSKRRRRTSHQEGGEQSDESNEN